MVIQFSCVVSVSTLWAVKRSCGLVEALATHRVFSVHGDGTPSSFSRLHSTLSSSFRAISRLRNQLVAVAAYSTPRVPGSRLFTACRQNRDYSRVWGSKLLWSFARVLDEQERSYAKWRDRETRVQHSNTDKSTKSDRKLLQCSRTTTRSILIYHLFLIYRWESHGHKITGASAMEPRSVLVTPLSITLAQGGPMPQQS